MDKYLKDHIATLLGISILKITPISGGDISQAYLLETTTQRFFCKLNLGKQAYAMFLAEKNGLEAISRTKTIATPKVLLCEALKKGGFLLMEYIEPKKASSSDMALIGHRLAALHQSSPSDTFGGQVDNFIGSLPQSNTKQHDWSTFYVQKRLWPQLEIARAKQLLDPAEIPSLQKMLKRCNSIFPEVKPSLLHGDLWSGNYLISKNGSPYLIDPAIYYGHHEVDIAMTRLFGGFNSAFYDAYAEHFPQPIDDTARMNIYQLYYLLVHLNLFGNSYYNSVHRILKTYF